MPLPLPSFLKPKPAAAKHLTLAEVASPGGSTLARVKFCISPYTSVRPIKNIYHVGALCQDLDFLGADLNVEFELADNKGFWRGEIEGGWSVQYLAGYTDLKIQAL